MNTNHTSGPWAIVSNGANVKVTDADGKAVCMLTPRRGMWNGDLIAAAPDLLEALKEALDQLYCWSREDEPTFTMQRAAEAIAKATGSTNL